MFIYDSINILFPRLKHCKYMIGLMT